MPEKITPSPLRSMDVARNERSVRIRVELYPPGLVLINPVVEYLRTGHGVGVDAMAVAYLKATTMVDLVALERRVHRPPVA